MDEKEREKRERELYFAASVNGWIGRILSEDDDDEDDDRPIEERGWNYRLIRHLEGDEEWFAIHDVWYDKEGKPYGCGETPECPCGDSIDELKEDLEHMLQALDRPVLEFRSFEEMQEKENPDSQE